MKSISLLNIQAFENTLLSIHYILFRIAESHSYQALAKLFLIRYYSYILLSLDLFLDILT